MKMKVTKLLPQTDVPPETARRNQSKNDRKVYSDLLSHRIAMEPALTEFLSLPEEVRGLLTSYMAENPDCRPGWYELFLSGECNVYISDPDNPKRYTHCLLFRVQKR